jgi:cation transport protein ChaC
MTDTPDPFAHHPELRDRIACSESSFFRGFNLDDLIKERPEMEQFRHWAHTDEERDVIRARVLANHTGDLWIFAYGSLMWDPALRFQEVRRVFAPGYARKLILKDDKGGRGSPEAPGLMGALDSGDGCEGLAYRIAEHEIDTEMEILFRREMIAPGYQPTFIPVHIEGNVMQVLTFVADHASPDMLPEISRTDQVRWIATGVGFLGSSRDYLVNIVEQLTHLGIDDPACTALLHEVDAYISGEQAKETAQ